MGRCGNHVKGKADIAVTIISCSDTTDRVHAMTFPLSELILATSKAHDEEVILWKIHFMHTFAVDV